MSITDFLAYLSSWAAVLGMALLAAIGLLSGRFSWLTGRWSIDTVMRIHQQLGRVVLILFMAHPLFYFLGDIRMSGSGLGLGFLALFALIAVVVMALSRDELPMRYEAWRRSHGLLAIGALGLGLAHAQSGGWLGQTIPAVYWGLVASTAVGVMALAWIYVIRPWALRRRPFRVVGLREVADRTWALRLQQVSGPAFCYQAGQFAWIKAQSAFDLHDHPFSIATAPAQSEAADRPVELGFLIKAVGDFTSHLEQHVPPGQTVYLDGPYGSFGQGLVQAPRLLLVAGGIGLAPLLSVLQARRDWLRSNPASLVTQVVIGNRHPGQYFADQDLTDSPGLGLQVHRLVSEPTKSWTGLVGQTDATGLGPLLPADPADWQALVCGPPPMMQTVQSVLVKHGFMLNQIHMETFKT